MIIRQLAIYFLSFCIGFTPTLAFSQPNSQTKTIKDFYQNSGYKAGSEIHPWLDKNKSKMHFKMRAMAERLAMGNPGLKLPNIDISEYKSGETTFTRMVIKSGKTQQIVDFHELNGKVFAKIDGRDFSYDDLYYDNVIAPNEINPQLTVDQLAQIYSVNPAAAGQYQVAFRELVNSLVDLNTVKQDQESRKYSFVQFILSVAYAYQTKKCIVGGNVSLLIDPETLSAAEKKSNKINGVNVCGYRDPNLDKSQCGPGKVRCNPLVYGYTSNDKQCISQPFSVPATDVSYKCDKIFPLNSPEDMKKFAANVIEKTKGESDSASSEKKFYKDLKDKLVEIGNICLGSEFNEQDFLKRAKSEPRQKFEDKDFLKTFPKHTAVSKISNKKMDYNEGHRTACMHALNRLVEAQGQAECALGSAEAPTGSVCPSPVKKPDEEEKKNIVTAEDKSCENINLLIRDYVDAGKNIEVHRITDDETKPEIRKANQTEEFKVITDLVEEQRAKMKSDPKFKCNLDTWPPEVVVRTDREVKPYKKDTCDPATKFDKCICSGSTIRGIGCALVGFGLLYWLLNRNNSSSNIAQAKPVIPSMPLTKEEPETKQPNNPGRARSAPEGTK